MSISKHIKEHIVLKTPSFGDVVTIGNGGMYATPEAYFSVLRGSNQLTPISSGVYTCTVTQNSKVVTLISGGAFDSGGIIKHGDAFSIDNATWYEIENVYSDGTILLATPYISATAAAQPFYLSRPIYSSIVLLPGKHGGICMDSALPMYVDMLALPGAEITGWVTQLTGGGAAKANIIYPRYGHIIARNLRLNYHKSSTDSAAGNRLAGGATTGTAASIIEEYNFYCKNEGVDSFAPYGMIGKLYAEGGFYEATNDNQFCITTDGAEFVNCRLIGNALALLEAAGILPLQQRIFSAGAGKTFRVRNCHIVINHPVADPGSISMLFGSDTSATYILDNCLIEIKTIAKTTAALITSVSGLAAAVVAKLNHCTIIPTGTGNFSLVTAATYTGAGAITLNLCSLGGAIDGGGGTMVITKNSCVA